MDEQVKVYLEKYPAEIADMFLALRRLVYDSAPSDLTETMWARLPSYCAGEKFVRLIPFKDHINIEARAVVQHRDALSGCKITPKGMLQVFVGQQIPEDVLKRFFAETLGNGRGGKFVYRELIEKMIEKQPYARLQEPCSEAEIAAAEQYVGFAFPDELKDLLRETNGDRWLLMSAQGIWEHAKMNREIYPEFLEPEEFEEKINRHVFFATNGCGDYYCYRVLPNGETDASAIYLWEHELFESRVAARDMAELITKYYNGEIG